MALLTTSQGNILCICIQRYIVARNIRNLTPENQSFHRNVCLLFVNIIVGTTSFILSTFQADISDESRRNEAGKMCDFLTALGASGPTVGRTFYFFQLTTTVAADIICLFTIMKLRREVKQAVNPSHRVTTSTNVCMTIKTRQHKAIVTMFLLLVFFNVSMLPQHIFVTLTILGFNDDNIPGRYFFLLLFFNSLVNPIIIMTRTLEIRQKIRELYLYIRYKFHRVFYRNI